MARALTLADFKNMRLPLWEALAGMVVVGGIVWGAFAWADDIEDKQKTTQTQLDQLVVIVSQSATTANDIHKAQGAEITKMRGDFDLLKQEVELRRELTADRDDAGEVPDPNDRR